MTRDPRPSSRSPTNDQDPTTLVVTRFVDPTHVDEYRQWLARLIAATVDAPGSLGTVVLAPRPGESNTFRIVLRFADAASLRAWEDCDTRRRLSAEADRFSTADDRFSTAEWQIVSGLEAWFSVPGEPARPPPPRWKTAIVTFFVAYALTAVIIPREVAWLPKSWSFYAVNVITNVLLVGLLTYIAMPTVARVLRRWLY